MKLEKKSVTFKTNQGKSIHQLLEEFADQYVVREIPHNGRRVRPTIERYEDDDTFHHDD